MTTKKMHKFLFIALLASIICISFAPFPKIIYRYKAFLGCKQSDSFTISKDDFQRLIANKLCAKDSAGNVYPVSSFEITYAERGLFQDSTGLPIIFTDYSFTVCKGDSIPSFWQADFRERGYKGDTIYFDRISVVDTVKSNMCKRIKCVIK